MTNTSKLLFYIRTKYLNPTTDRQDMEKNVVVLVKKLKEIWEKIYNM